MYMVAVAATAGTALGWPSTAGAAAAAAAGITMVGSLGRQGSLILKGVETLLGLSPARAGFGYKLQHSPHSARRTQGPMPQPKVSRAGLLGWCGATTKSQQGWPAGVVWCHNQKSAGPAHWGGVAKAHSGGVLGHAQASSELAYVHQEWLA